MRFGHIDMRFVNKFRPPNFCAKNFTPLISPNFNSFDDKNTNKLVKMEKFTPLAKKFTLPPAVTVCRPARIAELPRSKFDPELFPHSAYVEIFVTFATKVLYLTFCNKM